MNNLRVRLHGLYAVTPESVAGPGLVELTRQALVGGARLVQYRNKDGTPASRLRDANALRILCAEMGAVFVVNDDVALAEEVDADGVHLGRDDVSIAAARDVLGTHRIIGASCYADFARAETAVRAGADYLAFGSVFPSRTKPHSARADLTLIARAKRQLGLPIAAIGGIDTGNAGAVLAAGAAMLAVVSALFDAPDIERAASQFSSHFNPT